MTPGQKPVVGVSRCLLGDAVRYDGQSKANRVILDQLSQHFLFLPVCPEVEAGLTVPRPPVQLTGSISKPQLVGREDPALDITALMQGYCEARIAELSHLSGFIFKSRSPSCGLNSTPVYIDGHCITETARGVFASYFCSQYPGLAVIEESELPVKNRLHRFIQTVLKHHAS